MRLSAAFSLSLLASLSTIVVKSHHLRGELPSQQRGRRTLKKKSKKGDTFTDVGVGFCIDDDGNYPDYCERSGIPLSECLERAKDVDNVLGVEIGGTCNFLYANNDDVSSCPWNVETTDQTYTTTATEITQADGEVDWTCYKKN